MVELFSNSNSLKSLLKFSAVTLLKLRDDETRSIVRRCHYGAAPAKKAGQSCTHVASRRMWL
jgi:hypothetical protein